MTWRASDPQRGEQSKIRWDTVPYTRGRGLDIGCGPEKVWLHAIGVDNQIDTAQTGQAMDPDVKCLDAGRLDIFAPQSMDWVFSSHLLEHIDKWEEALHEWWRVLKPGGYLMLYLPHKDLYPNTHDRDKWTAYFDAHKTEYESSTTLIEAYAREREAHGAKTLGERYAGTPHANEDHKRDFRPEDIIEAMKKVGGWDLLENEDRDKEQEYSFWQVYKKLADGSHRLSCDAPRPLKTCAIVRYGAWGDVIQMSSILPGLKAQGYHITLYTETRSVMAIEHEPLIDRMIVQDKDQVPNVWLGPFFDSLSKKYDKFMNLCETVEASLLAMPERAPYHWSTEGRHAVMNQNYVEVLHKIVSVPYAKPAMRFVPSADEKAWVSAEKAKLGANPLIMWILAGSSIHKVYPHMDPILARVMLTWPEAKVITCGDARCQKMLEEPWKLEPRIIRRSNVWSIRETMSMAQACDIVIGPETGVMSAVSMEAMAKIVLLSHSSVENLTRDFVNTVSLHSTQTPCYPCHKMIYNWAQCNREKETGTAHCMANIPPDAVWDALVGIIDGLGVRVNPKWLEPVEEAA